jgi:hypothetical protein
VGLNLLISLIPGIDGLAHLGGALMGLGLVGSGLLTRGVRPLHQRTDGHEDAGFGWTGVASTLLVAAMVGCVAWALVHGRPWVLRRPEVVERVALGDTGLSVELPPELKRQALRDPAPGAKAWSFGEIGRDPVLIIVIAWPGAAADTAADDAKAVEHRLLDALEAEPASGVEGATPPRLETIAARPTLVRDGQMGGCAALWEWVTAESGHVVRVQTCELGWASPSWHPRMARVVESLRGAKAR